MPGVAFDLYEIDQTITLLPGIDRDCVVYCDFIQQTIDKTYMTIIGNPPYVRTKRGNLYIDFTKKCYRLLDTMSINGTKGGELIFIVPSDFLKLTCAAKLLNEMMQNGTFTHIFHPHNERMFENAAIDIMVFRYCKDATLEKRVLYNGAIKYITNRDGLITFGDITQMEPLFKDLFDVYVGLVSGKEDVYKNAVLGNIDVLNGESKVDKYIHIESFPSGNADIDRHLLANKPALITRGIRKFNESNWFEWGALRNISSVQRHWGQDCIYIATLTRKSTVAFLGKVGYFGGGLIMIRPKKTVDLHGILAYLNGDVFKCNFMFSGRFKIGHRQISLMGVGSNSL